MDETALTSTLDRTITLTALSMDEAREQARAMLAPMQVIVAEALLQAGETDLLQGQGVTARLAILQAMQQAPVGSRVVSARELDPAVPRTEFVLAHGEEQARLQARRGLKRGEVLVELELTAAAEKGKLGVGRKPAQYQASIVRQARVEVQYLAPSLYSFTLGPKRVYNLVRFWGGHGQRVEEFYAPAGIALDQAGRVYVTDNGLYMSKSGTLKQPYSRVVKFDANGRWLAMWGERGEGEGQMLEAQGIQVGPDGHVWVADGAGAKVVEFDPRMRPVRWWGGRGEGEGLFSGGALHLALAPDGSIYVSDRLAHRVSRFDRSGAYLLGWGGNGSDPGQFERPEGVAVDSAGNVYVADGGNDRIGKFTAEGAFLTQWGGRGVADGSLAVPRGLAIDRADCLYVTSAGIAVQKFSTEGEFLARWATYQPKNQPLSNPVDVAVGGAGRVYLLEASRKLVEVYE